VLTREPLGKRLSLLSIMQPSGSSSRLARGHASPHAYDDLLDQQVRLPDHTYPAPVVIISSFIRSGRGRSIRIAVRRGGSVGSFVKCQGCSKDGNCRKGKVPLS